LEPTQDAEPRRFFARRAAGCVRAAADLERMILQRDGTTERTDAALGALHGGGLALRNRDRLCALRATRRLMLAPQG